MAKRNLTTRAAFCPASSVRLSLLLMLQSNAIGFALPLALELYRKLLRNARHLPDPVVRSYVFYQTKRLFRERQFEFGRQKLVGLLLTLVYCFDSHRLIMKEQLFQARWICLTSGQKSRWR